MDIFDLLDRLEEISLENSTDCPEIYIQIGTQQVPLRGVCYFPETSVSKECIVLGNAEKPILVL